MQNLIFSQLSESTPNLFSDLFQNALIYIWLGSHQPLDLFLSESVGTDLVSSIA